MSVNINVQECNGVAVLSIEGHFDASMVNVASEKVHSIIEGVFTKIIFDFNNLTYISSAGLRVVLYTAKKMKAKEGVVALCCVNSSVQKVLDISGLSELLPSYENRESALTNI